MGLAAVARGGVMNRTRRARRCASRARAGAVPRASRGRPPLELRGELEHVPIGVLRHHFGEGRASPPVAARCRPAAKKPKWLIACPGRKCGSTAQIRSACAWLHPQTALGMPPATICRGRRSPARGHARRYSRRDRREMVWVSSMISATSAAGRFPRRPAWKPSAGGPCRRWS